MEETGLVFSIPTHTHIAYGNVVEEIINTARLFGAEWLILGTSPIAAAPMSYTPFSATNKAYRLMAAANIPVLTFPHRTHSINPSGSKDNTAVAKHTCLKVKPMNGLRKGTNKKKGNCNVVAADFIRDRILESVRNNHADLLVLGTKAKTEAGHMALGIVARGLMPDAHGAR